MARDVNHHVASCSVCSKTKVPHHYPMGKLLPLETPQCPWSHKAVDFITNMLESLGNTTILIIALPSAFELVEILFEQIFRHYGIPEDIVSDRSPQFTSPVWSNFLEKLGSRSVSQDIILKQIDRCNG